MSLFGTNATPLPGPENERVRKGFFRWVGSLIGLCRDYSVADLARLKEAGVSMVEGKARREHADAAEKLANAAAKQAEAAQILVNAQRDALKLAKEQAELAKEALELVDRRKVERVMARILEAIWILRMKNGAVAYDSNRIMQLIIKGLAENPADEFLKQIEEQLLHPNPEEPNP